MLKWNLLRNMNEFWACNTKDPRGQISCDFRFFRYTKSGFEATRVFQAPVFQPQKKNIQVPEAFCDNNRRGGTMEQEDDIEVELHFSCGLLVEVALTLLKRWAPTSYKWRYNNPYKWLSKRRTGIIIILIGSYYRSLNSIYTWWRGPLEVPLWYNMAMKHGSFLQEDFGFSENAGDTWHWHQHLFFFGGFGFRPKSMEIPDSF